MVVVWFFVCGFFLFLFFYKTCVNNLQEGPRYKTLGWQAHVRGNPSKQQTTRDKTFAKYKQVAKLDPNKTLDLCEAPFFDPKAICDKYELAPETQLMSPFNSVNRVIKHRMQTFRFWLYSPAMEKFVECKLVRSVGKYKKIYRYLKDEMKNGIESNTQGIVSRVVSRDSKSEITEENVYKFITLFWEYVWEHWAEFQLNPFMYYDRKNEQWWNKWSPQDKNTFFKLETSFIAALECCVMVQFDDKCTNLKAIQDFEKLYKISNNDIGEGLGGGLKVMKLNTLVWQMRQIKNDFESPLAYV